VDELVVVWRVYEPCNLACRFCGYSRELVRPRFIANVDEVIAFGEVLTSHAQLNGRSVLVSWLGGEPLLWPALPKVSRLVRRLGLRLGITTNGLPLASPAVRDCLVSNYEQVTVSVDGLAPFHDAVRGSPGLFDSIRENVRRLRAKLASSTVLRVNTILMRENVSAFGAFCEEMADWGFDELTFNQLGGGDRPEFFPANRLLPGQVERFIAELPGLRQRMTDRGLHIRGSSRYLNRLRATSLDERIPIDDCGPGERFLFIDEQSRVSPCSFTCGEYGVPLNELDTPEKLAALPGRFAAMRDERRAKACDDCHSTQVFEKFDRWFALSGAT
jgi:MoaA/NifB/PqqE/SkfB family radical SAM enzyme